MKETKLTVIDSTQSNRIGVKETFHIETKYRKPGEGGGGNNKPRMTLTKLVEMFIDFRNEVSTDIKKIKSILARNNIK